MTSYLTAIWTMTRCGAAVARQAHNLKVASSILATATIFTLTGCGFGQIGPETLIVADTPCGRVEYHSTKDQSAPAAACEADGYKLRIGSDNASGLGALSEAWAKAFVAAAGAAK